MGYDEKENDRRESDRKYMKELGERIRSARLRAGFTQEELAERLNLSRGCIARYELGEIEPKVQNLAAIAVTLGVSTDYLLGLGRREERLSSKMSEQAYTALENFVDELIKVR